MVKMGAVNKLISMLGQFRPIQLAKSVCFDRAGSDVVLVCGSGRSGTSWLANICNYQNDFRYLFEPLNPVFFEPTESVQWCLSTEQDFPVLRSALEGKVSNKWVNSRNRRVFAKRRLVKEIRSNFMLSWVNENYPKTKIVLITRNPLAVAASRKSLSLRQDNSKWVWEPELSVLLNEPALKESLNQTQFDALSSQVGKGIVLETIADWCINNLIVYDHLERNTYFHVYYEHLVSNGQAVCKQLMRYIGVEYHACIEQALTRTSETSRSPVVLTWRDVLTKQEIREATELLAIFGVERLYTADWQPVIPE